MSKHLPKTKLPSINKDDLGSLLEDLVNKRQEKKDFSTYFNSQSDYYETGFLKEKSPPKTYTPPVSHEEIIDDSQYKNVMNMLNKDIHALFVTGQAGTGKSTFIKYLRQKISGIPVVAPTGIAAINVEGQTIHSFFRIPPRIMNHHEIEINYKLKEIVKRLNFLIIDEISMVRADMLDLIDKILKIHTGKDIPFGGIKMILIGDLFQLPPVIASKDESDYVYSKYMTSYFLDAKIMKRCTYRTFELTKVYRQQDLSFIELLSNIREGKNVEPTINEINEKCYHKELSKNAIILTPTNSMADKINHERLHQIKKEEKTYFGTVIGEFGRNDRFPAPLELTLKEGAQVMFVKNDTRGRWVNGTIGRVHKLFDDYIQVRVDGTIHNVDREGWENIKYTFLKDSVIPTNVGTYFQYPLVLAWAVTIHKSQGKTFDNVYINIANGAFADGQLYVALSRCRTLEGISLIKKISVNDVKVNKFVKSFYDELKKDQGKQS